MQTDLIYDVGLLDGADTAYYLFRGYRVVAIDANPLMIENAYRLFSAEIAAKRLTLLNVGISKNKGSELFWISDAPEWSSFNSSIASREGTPRRSITVPTTGLQDLLIEYGVPHYLKIDIEGNDGLCIGALKGCELPRFVSVESECVGDSAHPSDEEVLSTLNLLRDAGYKRFKLVAQTDFKPVRRGVARLAMRCVNGAASGRLKIKGLDRLLGRFSDGAHLKKLNFEFVTGSSGPWGDDIPGKWMSFSTARAVYLEERRRFFETFHLPSYSFWYDWHATE